MPQRVIEDSTGFAGDVHDAHWFRAQKKKRISELDAFARRVAPALFEAPAWRNSATHL